MKKLGLIICGLLFLSGQAMAANWYFVEPAVGYYQGHYQTNKVTGLGFNFKGGFNWDRMYIGADIGYATELNVSAVAYDIDMNNTGVVIGYNTGGFRVWYSMITGSTLEYKSGATEYSAAGSGSKFGLGGKISGNTYYNLEVNFLKYDELSTDGSPADVDYFMDVAFLSFSWVI